MIPIPLPRRKFLNDPLEPYKTDEEILADIEKRYEELETSEEEPIEEGEIGEGQENQQEFFEKPKEEENDNG